jgi:hypothetical protein
MQLREYVAVGCRPDQLPSTILMLLSTSPASAAAISRCSSIRHPGIKLPAKGHVGMPQTFVREPHAD